MSAQRWRVVGGGGRGGLLVRLGKELASAQAASRLSTGAIVKELELDGDRLHYRRLTGEGPDDGWVSVKVSDRNLLLPWKDPAENGAALLAELRAEQPRRSGLGDSRVETAVWEAARAIREADAILVGTGAGMGVDSGLGTFRGRNAGIWPPLQRLGLEFPQVSTPSWFREDPHFAWAFWWFRYEAYTACEPHAGYWLLADWGRRKRSGFFSFTSNIDGHWELVGAPTYECHGTLRFLQCLQGEACHRGCWPAPPDLHFELEDGRDDHVKDPLPRCPKCGGIARPAVLMFGDWGYCSPRDEEQSQRYEDFLSGLGSSKLAVVEIGAGTAVATVRMACQRASRRPGATLIRINLEDAGVPAGGVGISLGALDALRLIDEELRRAGWVETAIGGGKGKH